MHALICRVRLAIGSLSGVLRGLRRLLCCGCLLVGSPGSGQSLLSEPVDGIIPEYAVAAERYFGHEQGQAWIEQLGKMVPSMVRIRITPEWVGLLDFQSRFPSALSA